MATDGDPVPQPTGPSFITGGFMHMQVDTLALICKVIKKKPQQNAQSLLLHSSDLGMLTLAALLFALERIDTRKSPPSGPRSKFGVI